MFYYAGGRSSTLPIKSLEGTEVTKEEFEAFIDSLPKPSPEVVKTLEEKIRTEVLKMKDEGLIQ